MFRPAPPSRATHVGHGPATPSYWLCVNDALLDRVAAPPLQLQVRDSNFTASPHHWGLYWSSAVVNATVDWREGEAGAEVTIHRSGAGTAFISVSQLEVLLCENFRYRLQATLRSLKSRGSVTLNVNGGRENNYADLLPDAPMTVPLTSEWTTWTQVRGQGVRGWHGQGIAGGRAV